MVGFGPKTQNRAAGAWLRVRHREWLFGVMGGCGGMVYTRWWWCGGAALGHKRGVVGFGPNTRNRAIVARFRACCGEWLSEAMGRGGAMVRTRWWWSGGGAALGHASRQVGFGPEIRNRAPGARLRVRRREWQLGAMGGCGGMVRTRLRWCGGAVLGHKRGVVGFGRLIPKPSHSG
jgi:hypothetical protein